MCLGHICNHPYSQENVTQKYVNKTKQSRLGRDDGCRCKMPSIKDVRSQGGGRFVHCGQKGFFRCGRPHFFAQGLRIFRNLWCVRLSQCGERRGVWASGVEPVRRRRERSIFAILYGRLLWIAPNVIPTLEFKTCTINKSLKYLFISFSCSWHIVYKNLL